MQHIAFFEKLFEEFLVSENVELGCGRDLFLIQKAVKPGQSFRVSTHVVCVLRAVYRVGIKQNRNIPPTDIGVGDVYSRFTRKNKISHNASEFFAQ